jgi:hypothetical protein
LELSRDQGIKVLFIEQGFLVGFAGILAIDTNTLAGEVLGRARRAPAKANSMAFSEA